MAHLPWLLAGSFSSLPCGPLLRAPWAFLEHITWLLPEHLIQETGQGECHVAFYDLTSGVIFCHFHHILFNKSESLSEALFKDRKIKLHLFFCGSLGRHPQHMEVPRLGVELELQPPAYATAIATRDPSHVCDLHYLMAKPHP